ncbi:hypothetical protein ACP70R_019326 [Stipagrostis hirtigluma subsp. patula]
MTSPQIGSAVVRACHHRLDPALLRRAASPGRGPPSPPDRATPRLCPCPSLRRHRQAASAPARRSLSSRPMGRPVSSASPRGPSHPVICPSIRQMLRSKSKGNSLRGEKRGRGGGGGGHSKRRWPEASRRRHVTVASDGGPRRQRSTMASCDGAWPWRTAVASSGGGPCVAMEAAVHDHGERRRSERDCRRRSGRDYGGGHSGTVQLRWPGAATPRRSLLIIVSLQRYVDLSSGGDSSGSDDELEVPEDLDEKMTIPAVENESQNEDVKPADSYDAVLAWSIAHVAQHKAKMDGQQKKSVYSTYTEVPRCCMDEQWRMQLAMYREPWAVLGI